jgi:hypothetical protein
LYSITACFDWCTSTSIVSATTLGRALLHLKEGVPLERAKRQLSLRYGHSRFGRSGVLDLFFDRYIEDNRRTPVAFLDWVETVYDPEELTRAFQCRGAGPARTREG